MWGMVKCISGDVGCLTNFLELKGSASSSTTLDPKGAIFVLWSTMSRKASTRVFKPPSAVCSSRTKLRYGLCECLVT